MFLLDYKNSLANRKAILLNISSGSKEARTELIKVIEGFASEWKHPQHEATKKK